MIKNRIIIAVSAAVLILVLICLLPWPTKVDLTLNAIKLDSEGEEVGSQQIIMEGQKLDYLFKDARMNLSFTPFDGFVWIKPTEVQPAGTTGNIWHALENDILYVRYYGCDRAANIHLLILGFSPDLDRWILLDHTDNVCYVASVNADHTVQELKEYFKILISAISQ